MPRKLGKKQEKKNSKTLFSIITQDTYVGRSTNKMVSKHHDENDFFPKLLTEVRSL